MTLRFVHGAFSNDRKLGSSNYWAGRTGGVRDGMNSIRDELLFQCFRERKRSHSEDETSITANRES